MGVKVYKAKAGNGEHYGYMFECPGCEHNHIYWTEKAARNGAKWTFNGNLESPTFKASLLNVWPRGKRRCHLFVTDGKIQYLGDCTHHLAGQTVEMKDINDD